MRLFSSVVFALFVASGIAPEAQVTPSGHTFVAVTDKSGEPVLGLTASDFVARVNGEAVDVLDVGPATEALALVLVADVASPELVLDARAAMRAVMAAVRRHHPGSRVGLMLRTERTAPVLRDVIEAEADLEQSISHLVGVYDNAPLLENIIVATAVLSEETARRRIVVSIAGRSEDSVVDVAAPSRVTAALRDAGVSFWALDMTMAFAAPGSDEARVLADATRLSGGRYQFVRPSGLAVMVSQLMAVIRSQYVVSYTVNAAAESQPLGVGVRRDRVIVLAPSWTSPPGGGQRPRPSMELITR